MDIRVTADTHCTASRQHSLPQVYLALLRRRRIRREKVQLAGGAVLAGRPPRAKPSATAIFQRTRRQRAYRLEDRRWLAAPRRREEGGNS